MNAASHAFVVESVAAEMPFVCSGMTSDGSVTLDVGGTMFRASRATLRCDSACAPNYFSANLSGRWDPTDGPAVGSAARPLFVDRPPHLFVAVLHFLRTGQIVPQLTGLPADRTTRTLQEICDELEYFGITVPFCAQSIQWHHNKEELLRCQHAMSAAQVAALCSTLVDPLFDADTTKRRPFTRVFLSLETAATQKQLGNAVKVALGVALHKADVVCDDALYYAAASNAGRFFMRRHASRTYPETNLRIGLSDCLGESLKNEAAVVEVAFAATLSGPEGGSGRGSPAPQPLHPIRR